ncbi:MAG: helix-turn-helix domain-containing protein [Gammaproteobacteria bacterium]|nr:helix-turn-helix domain-containing protein [Gammaproteobacteria bacterium]NIO24077.1 helix-turn-helix domain-containing protein [Gammaproteobacteria bacterium]NIO64727.1 helix-turn-helix domain-containing protein [Gammaproteobacteria bacterium]NIP63500.1 helix-turn-helix domain-containing protein [Gammaproteobacteria bacterium]NIQ25906.1 helix-turn-helix domain-containing protein [Gammaproteobacteria bacterium]
MPLPQFLTTKEVADLLRIKERKVYELATDGAIPVSRVTGKLLFPRELVELWVQRHVEYQGGRESLRPHPLVLAGSHDPLLEWALRESGSGIATFFDGSLDGVQRLAAGTALAAGLHVHDAASGEWNREIITRAMPGMPVVMIEWARRRQGIVLPAGNPAGVAGVRDLLGLKVIPRQPNAGSQVLLEQLLEAEGIAADALQRVGPAARSETDVALAVADGKAEAGFAIEAAARQLRLDFVPLADERYDLAVWRRDYFEAPMQRLLAFAREPALAGRAEELGGYDVSELGKVHYNGP